MSGRHAELRSAPPYLGDAAGAGTRYKLGWLVLWGSVGERAKRRITCAFDEADDWL
jgi:hypothetical protein